jgi:hypothetical protein
MAIAGLFAGAFGAMMLTTPASAAPWCANTADIGGFLQDCSYFTFGQCLATIHGLTGYCSANPRAEVLPYPPPPRHRKRHPRARY